MQVTLPKKSSTLNPGMHTAMLLWLEMLTDCLNSPAAPCRSVGVFCVRVRAYASAGDG
eukprot:m.508899 g.508899  ORF g.508899 m.508899 type:complete len:58 (-) comp21888_c1_seq1:1443-1616(-)